MPDLITPYAGLTKPTVGADDNNWGDLLNGDLDLIDSFLRQIVPPGTMFEYAAAAAPAAFLLCNGQAVSRTTYAALFAVIGTTWGAGDGSTTFNVPDRRDRFPVGSGGAYALAATGGAASFTPTLSVAIATHALTVGEMPTHNHVATDTGHSHADAGHAHTLDASFTGSNITDGGHGHSVNGGELAYINTGQPFGLGGGGSWTGFSPGALNADSSASNITFNDPGHGHTLHTGFASIQASNANITMATTGGGAAHGHGGSTATSNAVPTLPPYVAVNYIIKT